MFGNLKPAFVIAAVGLLSLPAHGAEKPIEDLIRRLGSTNFKEREQAAKELIDLGAPALEPLRAALQSTDPEIVRRAKGCIPIIERNQAIAALIADVKDRPREVQQKAIDRLSEFGPFASAAVPAMLPLLDDPDLRAKAIRTLAAIGPAAKPASPKILGILGDRMAPDLLRHAAAAGLAAIDPNASEPIPVLLDILENDTVSMKKSAANAIGQFRTKDKRVIQALIAALKQEDFFVRSNSAIALGKIHQEPSLCVPALIEVLSKPGGPRGSALTSLAQFGQDAKPAIPLALDYIREHIDSRDNKTQFACLDAFRMLQTLGPHAREAVPELQKLLAKYPRFTFRAKLANAIAVINESKP